MDPSTILWDTVQNLLFSVQTPAFASVQGKLIGICGESKCGKTSLLLAMLGHLHEICGQVFRDGNFAYVGERPWIWTASVRENILFKEPFHHKR